MTHTSLEDLESQAYQDSLSDGLTDLAIGLSLAWIGIIWLWIESLPGLAGILPAVLTWAVAYIRGHILDARVGYVRWRAPRLSWQGRRLVLLAGLVMAAFLLGNGVMYALRQGETLGTQGIVPALPAFVLGVGAFVGAAKARLRRLWGYGVVLVAAAVVTIVAEANPGASLLVSGAIMASIGAGLLTRFLRTHPVRDLG